MIGNVYHLRVLLLACAAWVPAEIFIEGGGAAQKGPP